MKSILSTTAQRAGLRISFDGLLQRKWLASLTLAFMAFAQTTRADLADGLVAHYQFEGNANDTSGYSRHGQIVGDTNFVAGIFGQAIHLNGRGSFGAIGDHVLIPSVDFVPSNALSISLWVREEGMSFLNGEAYISYGDHYGGGIVISHFDDSLFTTASVDANNTGIVTPFDTASLSNWVHYCLAYTNGHQAAYRNGILLGTTNVPLNLYGTNAGIGIHWWDYGNQVSTRFIGEVDEVRVYNRALTTTEVGQLCLRPQLRIAVSQVRLCWDSLTNATYQVQYRSELTTNIWQNLGNSIVGDGGNQCLTDEVAGPARLYRLVVTP